GQLGLGFGIRIAPRCHPVTQRLGNDTQIASHFRDRPAGPAHHLHRLSLELRAELPAPLCHEQILSVERPRPRSLVHPNRCKREPRLAGTLASSNREGLVALVWILFEHGGFISLSSVRERVHVTSR